MLCFTIAIVLFIAAVVLFNNWNSHASRCAINYLAQVDASYSDYNDCASQKNGIWYGAVVCLAVGAVFKLMLLSVGLLTAAADIELARRCLISSASPFLLSGAMDN